MHKYQPRLHVIVLDPLDDQMNGQFNNRISNVDKNFERFYEKDYNKVLYEWNNKNYVDKNCAINNKNPNQISTNIHKDKVNYCETCAKYLMNKRTEEQSTIDPVNDHNLKPDQNKFLKKRIIDMNFCGSNNGLNINLSSDTNSILNQNSSPNKSSNPNTQPNHTKTNKASLENSKFIDSNSINTFDHQMVNHDTQNSLNRSYSNFKLSTCYRCQTNLNQSNYFSSISNKLANSDSSSTTNLSNNLTQSNIALTSTSTNNSINLTKNLTNSSTNDSSNQSPIIRFKTFSFIETQFIAVTCYQNHRVSIFFRILFARFEKKIKFFEIMYRNFKILNHKLNVRSKVLDRI